MATTAVSTGGAVGGGINVQSLHAMNGGEPEQSASFSRQLRILLWRNYLIKKRLWGSTLAEVLIPVFVMLIMVGIRAAITIETKGIDYHLDDANIFSPGNQTLQQASFPVYPPSFTPAVIQPIAFIPAGVVEPLMEAFLRDHPIYRNHTVLFASDSAFDEYIKDSMYGTAEKPYIHFGILLNTIGTPANNYAWDYTLRVNNSDLTAGGNEASACYPTVLPDTENLLLTYFPLYHTMYLTQGFVWLQDWCEQYFIKQSVPGLDGINRQFRTVPFPTPPYIFDIFADVIENVLGLFFTLVYIWPVTRIVKSIVEEKELRQKEGMRVMGLKEAPLWLSWLIMYAFMFMITAILIVAVTTSVFPHSNKGYIFLFFWQFGLCVFAFAYMVSVFFSKARVASTTGALFFLGSFFGYFGVTPNDGQVASIGAKIAASLSATINFSLGAGVIVRFESAGVGVTSENAGTMVKNFSYDTGAIMFFVDFMLYMLIALYFERVIPNEWGTNLPYTFCCRPSFWCGDAAGEATTTEDAAARAEYDRQHNVEKVDDDTKKGLSISINKLTKEFPASDPSGIPRRAVNELSLNTYDGQIFALLGHNGAGKSTLMSMLTGMAPSTAGNISIGGYHMGSSSQVEKIRQRFGFCPQHDILYDLLTVKEHLEMFAGIKGVPEHLVDEQVKSMIKDLQLEEKTNVSAFALSGGMKRRLSVGIAMIGGSKILFLDEPTTGMDPFARRATWELLQRNKAGRCIILSTHFMDEADVLGDRIGILASGTLKCCGSSLFLKNLYGVGYTLSISKQVDERGGTTVAEHGANGNGNGNGHTGKPQFDEKAVEAAIKSITKMPQIDVLSNIAGEISYRLPFQASRTFADLFEAFDAPNNHLGVASYGVSVTTLEEVFIRVGHGLSPTMPVTTPRAGGGSIAADHKVEFQFPAGASGAAAPVVNNGMVTITIQPSGNGNSLNPSTGLHSSSPRGDYGATSPVGGLTELKLQNIGASAGMQSAASTPVLGGGRDLVATFRAKDLSGSAYYWRHFTALFTKRYQNAKRDTRVWTWTCLYPVLVSLIGIGAMTVGQGAQPDYIINPNGLNVVNRVPFDSHLNGGPVLNAVFNAQHAAFVPVNLTSESILGMSEYLIQTYQDTEESRYGAFRYNRLTPAHDYTNTSGVYADEIDLYYNATYYNAIPSWYNLVNNAVLRTLTGRPAASITLHSHPMPVTTGQGNLTNSLVAVVFALAFSFITASFVGNSVKEEADKVKHQQLISGVPSAIYWASSYAWDFLNYLLPGFLCVAVLALFNIKETLGENAGATILAMLLHGLSVTPFAYLCSFLFVNHSTAQNTMLIISFFSGAILLIASIVLNIIESTRAANDVLRFFYRLLPSFCFGEAIADLIVRQSAAAYGEPKGIWDMQVVGWPMLYMALESFVYFGLVLVVEYVRATPALLSVCHPPTQLAPEDEAKNREPDDRDVEAEKQRLLRQAQDPSTRDMISIIGLRKVYAPPRPGMKPHLAVEGLYLGIPEGQCFGYLGVNGAGKTTTLKMLSNDVPPSTGVAYLNNLNILTQQQEVRHLLGYCPQFDSLIDNLTAREHLRLYARIKGVPEEDVALYAEQMIGRLGLQEGIADKPSKEYSGGNKRKLCVGIALIGNPPIVFLDEPSSGMDPVSRRSMWDLIASTMKGRSVILTTHSMEECEALCSRIGIMVNGRLTCVGGAQHLKSRFGADYLVDASVHDPADRQRLTDFMNATFPGSTVFESHGSSVKYKVLKNQLPNGVGASTGVAAGAGADAGAGAGALTTVSLQTAAPATLSFAQIFRLMEANVSKFNVREYSVSQATLEQIFLLFASKQKAEIHLQ